jgi:hypothetical protein
MEDGFTPNGPKTVKEARKKTPFFRICAKVIVMPGWASAIFPSWLGETSFGDTVRY